MNPRTETKRIMLHCSATPEGREVTYDDLWQWHVVDNGWSHIGYHWLVQLDNTVVECRPEELEGAGCSGQNEDTIHICYAGGLASDGKTAKDTRTPGQIEATVKLLREIKTRYPHLTSSCIVGHNQYDNKACPSFDVPDWVNQYLQDESETGPIEPGMPAPPIGMDLAALNQRVAKLEQLVEDLIRWKNDE